MAPHNVQLPELEPSDGAASSASSSAASSISSSESQTIATQDGGDDVKSESSFTISGLSGSGLMTYAPIELPIPQTFLQLLIDAAGTEDLESVEEMKIRVLGRDVSLQRLASFLPNLRMLDLHGSAIRTLRELGCDLVHLQTLNVSKCGLTSLDGILGLDNLEELYANGNRIDDVAPCATVPNLKLLHLKGNRVIDIQCIGFLSMCLELKDLCLDECPVTSIPDYRRIIKYLLPQIITLDGQSYVRDDSNSVPVIDKDTSLDYSSVRSTACDISRDDSSSFSDKHVRTKSSSSLYSVSSRDYQRLDNIGETNGIGKGLLKLPPIKNAPTCPGINVRRPSTSHNYGAVPKSLPLINRPSTSRGSNDTDDIGDLERAKDDLRNVPFVSNPFSHMDLREDMAGCYQTIYREVIQDTAQLLLSKPKPVVPGRSFDQTKELLREAQRWRVRSATFRANNN